jgi:hypothetical protein
MTCISALVGPQHGTFVVPRERFGAPESKENGVPPHLYVSSHDTSIFIFFRAPCRR